MGSVQQLLWAMQDLLVVPSNAAIVRRRECVYLYTVGRCLMYMRACVLLHDCVLRDVYFNKK